MMNNSGKMKVLVPDSFLDEAFTGKIYGKYIKDSGVFNIYTEEMKRAYGDHECLGEIFAAKPENENDFLTGYHEDGEIRFIFGGKSYKTEYYNLIQNIFSRNTGILETGKLREKTVIIAGCGSVGSLVALELARSGVGKFVLIDNDILEYHNICRHQCSVIDVGNYKVNVLMRRIREINPDAKVVIENSTLEHVGKSVFDEYCIPGNTVMIGCADDRASDVYANSLAVIYKIPFVSIGCWERAAAGEVFYWLPDAGMPCYECAIGSDSGFSNRENVNRRIYTTQEDEENINFEPGISVDISFVTIVALKIVLDILNHDNESFTPRVLDSLKQYTLICNTNKTEIGGDMVEIFHKPLMITDCLETTFCKGCPPCKYE